MHRIERDLTIIVPSCVRINVWFTMIHEREINIGALLPNHIESSLLQCEPSNIAAS